MKKKLKNKIQNKQPKKKKNLIGKKNQENKIHFQEDLLTDLT